MKTKSRSAVTGKYVSKAKAKRSPRTTVRETTAKFDGIATLTINTSRLTATGRSRLALWLFNKAWGSCKTATTWKYNPADWSETR